MAFNSSQRPMDNVCRQLGVSEHLPTLERAWQAEMGGWEKMARIAAIDNFSLIVEVTSSPAMQEMNMRRRELVRKLNRYFKVPFLRDITVRMMHGD